MTGHPPAAANISRAGATSAIEPPSTRLSQRSTLGSIDVLINNAGIGAVGDISQNNGDEWARVLDINVTGLARVSAAALPHLGQSHAACIVNVSSVVAAVGVPSERSTPPARPRLPA